MNCAWIRPMLIRAKHWAVKNAPHILMGMGTAGSVTAVIFAVKATPAAVQAKKNAEFEKTAEANPEDTVVRGFFRKDMERLTFWEKVKACGKYYIPAVGLELFSLGCFWGAHGIDLKRQAVLAGLYSSAEAALSEYQRKVTEMIGDKAEKEIRGAVAQDRIDKDPPPNWIISDEDNWCYYNGYRFRSNYRKLKDIQNDANAEMIRNLYLSESDLLWMFDPEHKWVIPDSSSRIVGWSVDRLMEFDIIPGYDKDHQVVLTIDIRDKDGHEYLPVPGYSASL